MDKNGTPNNEELEVSDKNTFEDVVEGESENSSKDDDINTNDDVSTNDDANTDDGGVDNEVDNENLTTEEYNMIHAKDFNAKHPTLTIGENNETVPQMTLPSNTFEQSIEYARITGDTLSNMNANHVDYVIHLNNFANSMKLLRNDHSKHFFAKDLKPYLDVDGVEVKPKFLTLKNKKGGNNLIASISKAVSAGDNIRIPMYHSGFQISVKPSTNKELTGLKRKLDKLTARYAIETAGLIYTNRSNILNKVIMEYIVSKTIATTLKIKEGDNLLDYIEGADMPIAVMFLTATMFPGGYSAVMGCKHNATISDNKIACNFMTQSRINILNMLRVNNDAFDSFMCEIMNRTISGSVTLTERATYIHKLKTLSAESSSFKIETETGDIEFELGFKNCTEIFTSTDNWINSITTGLEDVIMEEDENEEERRELLDSLISLSILGNYSSFIKSISHNDNKNMNEKVIIDILNMLSEDDTIYEKIYKNINTFIDMSTVASVAFNNFICPSCNKLQKNPSENYWDSYISVDPATYFLDQLSLKLKYQKRRAM